MSAALTLVPNLDDHELHLREHREQLRALAAELSARETEVRGPLARAAAMSGCWSGFGPTADA